MSNCCTLSQVQHKLDNAGWWWCSRKIKVKSWETAWVCSSHFLQGLRRVGQDETIHIWGGGERCKPLLKPGRMRQQSAFLMTYESHWQGIFTSVCLDNTCIGRRQTASDLLPHVPIWRYPNSHAFSCFYVNVMDLICAASEEKIWGRSLKSCSVNPASLHLALSCMLVIGLQSDSSWQLKSIGLNTLKTQNVIQSAKKFPKVERMHRDHIEK